jgi:hypothetical protein
MLLQTLMTDGLAPMSARGQPILRALLYPDSAIQLYDLC